METQEIKMKNPEAGHKNHSAKKNIPSDGWAGFKENFTTDALAGFLVFLLAMPLSLGIAKASQFPMIFGLVTAIIGGVIVSFFMGSRLSIKGPAAGLIVIVSGSVVAFGDGEQGWHLALGAVVVAGVIQVLFGILKLGKLADFSRSRYTWNVSSYRGYYYGKAIEFTDGNKPGRIKRKRAA